MICTLCDGQGCEEGCGDCEMTPTFAGPDAHKVCRRCDGRGSITIPPKETLLTEACDAGRHRGSGEWACGGWCTSGTGSTCSCPCHEHDDEKEPCQCGRMSIGSGRNWNPDCPEHGLGTPWWTSPEQVEKRRVQNERTRSLQAQARAARAAISASSEQDDR